MTRLALRSKAHWGYDEVFMRACREELTVSPTLIREAVVRLIERRESPAGFYALRAGAEPHVGEVELFYVDPSAIGQGYGRALWRDAVERAGALGYRYLMVHSDPYAEGFYRAMGAQRIGDVASGSIEGRRLPLLRFSLAGVE